MADILVTTGVDNTGFRRGLGRMHDDAKATGRRVTAALDQRPRLFGAGSRNEIGKGLIGAVLGGGAFVSGIRLATSALREFAKENQAARDEFAQWGRVKNDILADIGSGLFNLIGGKDAGNTIQNYYQGFADAIEDQMRALIGNDGPGETAADRRAAQLADRELGVKERLEAAERRARNARRPNDFREVGGGLGGQFTGGRFAVNSADPERRERARELEKKVDELRKEHTDILREIAENTKNKSGATAQ